MTSNLGGREITEGKTVGFEQPDAKASFEKMEQKVRDEVDRVFNPEFLNRLDDVIVFHPLTREHIAQIVDIVFGYVRERISGDGYSLRRTDAATEFLVAHGYDEMFGARPLKRAIQRYVEDPLSDKILMGDFSPGDEIEVDVSPDGDKLEFRVLSHTQA
jgi:ATP-dependent Clp protease ATP-binding subunit ClpC